MKNKENIGKGSIVEIWLVIRDCESLSVNSKHSRSVIE